MLKKVLRIRLTVLLIKRIQILNILLLMEVVQMEH